MNVEQATLEKKYHDAVEHWQRHYIPDMPWLLEHWDKFFPRDEPFCLCAKLEIGTPTLVQIGDHVGEPKRARPEELTEEEARHILAIIRAQCSTEFGSIQQHNGTVGQAPDDETRAWILRVMAEELRHAYQMLFMLTSQDWSKASSGARGEDVVEELLSMRPGGHVLDAFNLMYESILDNFVFAAIIDRVGKWQLTMQKVCAFKPFADSMPPMLREEAFHLAAGVKPLRNWAAAAGRGEPFISMPSIQRAVNKWSPRGLEMFGDERGGQTNIDYGFKDLKNLEAQDGYVVELERMLRDINTRFIRAHYPKYRADQAEQALATLERGERHNGLAPEDVLDLPDRWFFRRRGEPAWTMIGVDGMEYADVDQYLRYLGQHLSEAYMASADVRMYANTLRKVVAGELTPKDATRQMPKLKRVGGTCPCSKSIRWVVEDAEAS